MVHASLFSGIGGFDLAALQIGWDNLFHCEYNEFCQKVLSYYFPNSIAHHDIIKTDFTIYRGRVDILTGGFPCQPYSVAGEQKGTEDPRHLWPEMLRAIREIQPRWIVGENVFGLINWKKGLVFDEIQTQLEAEGYEVWPYVLPACGVNAPHRRDRVWFIAYAGRNGYQPGRLGESGSETSESNRERLQRQRFWTDIGGNGEASTIADSERKGSENREQGRKSQDSEKNRREMEFEPERYGNNGITSDSNSEFEQASKSQKRGEEERSWGQSSRSDKNTDSDSRNEGLQRDQQSIIQGTIQPNERRTTTQLYQTPDWANWPTVSPVHNGDDGLSARLDAITFSKWRNESIKAGGNAIVPKVALGIFKTIEEYIQLHGN